jgi:PAS domain S-box-containing protein
MSNKEPTYEELEAKLAQVEEIVVALRREEVDAVVGKNHVLFLRLKNVEEALRESEEKHRTLTENSHTGVFIHRDGKYVFVNDRFAEIHGYTTEELLGKDHLTLVHPDEREIVRQMASERLKGEAAPQRYEVRRLRKDGKSMWCEVMAKRVQHRGRPAIMGNIIDISERKRAEEALRKAHEELEIRVREQTEKLLASERLATLGKVSGSISHELRNPLGVIDSSAYYLRARLKDADEKVQEHLGRIQTNVGRATAIIESLLNLTQMKEPRLERLGLLAIISDAIATSKAPDTVNVIRSVPEEDILVNADREQLGMAFRNIVTNAVEAMDGKGTLTVTLCRSSDDEVELRFADTGRGIAPDNLDKIFKPLFSTKARGIGFGLCIARMVIEKHGGTIEAKSEEGRGATIILRIPLFGHGKAKNDS